MLRSIRKQSGESGESVLREKRNKSVNQFIVIWQLEVRLHSQTNNKKNIIHTVNCYGWKDLQKREVLSLE